MGSEVCLGFPGARTCPLSKEWRISVGERDRFSEGVMQTSGIDRVSDERVTNNTIQEFVP